MRSGSQIRHSQSESERRLFHKSPLRTYWPLIRLKRARSSGFQSGLVAGPHAAQCVFPIARADDGKRESENFRLLGSSRRAEDVVHRSLSVRSANGAGAVGPEAEIQTSFVSVVDVTVQDECVDSLQA